MEFTGRLVNVNRDWISNQLQLTFTVNEPSAVNEVNNIKDVEKLTVKAVKWRKKRSLDANAYAWKIMSELADVMRTSKDELYEIMLARYGANETDDDGNIVKFSLLSSIDVSKMHIHCAFIGKGHVGDKEFSHYRLIKGSSEYDTKEMSIFIDGIVSECKEVGIETMTPDEIAQIKAAWKGAGKCVE